MPFRRILVKTRTSTSFSSELKDFIGPFDFFRAAPVEAAANVPLFCGPMGISDIFVTNPLPASVYTWSTPDGHFVYPPTGTEVRVDQPGTYIVTHQLLDGCSSYASDTVVITHDLSCTPLDQGIRNFAGTLHQNEARLKWRIATDAQVQRITVQRSFDGKTFQNIHTLDTGAAAMDRYTDVLKTIQTPQLYYRLLVLNTAGQVKYTPVVRLQPSAQRGAMLYPNPAATVVQLSLYNENSGTALITVRNASGAVVYASTQTFSKGHTLVSIDAVRTWRPGLYVIGIAQNGQTEWLKLLVSPKESSAVR
jgi:hypothetical protein